MFRLPIRIALFLAIVTINVNFAYSAPALKQRATEALELFQDAENRFQTPDTHWFETTRQALQEESSRVEAALDAQGEEYSQAWKDHLRWHLLTKNLGPIEEVNLDELALVRRWLYSNRKGLEYPFFAELRVRADAHLDAVYTFSQLNLQEAFETKLSRLRKQIRTFSKNPNDTNLAALGRTLGWLERTRQLPIETAAARSLLSLPNAQVVVSKPLIDRAIALLASDVQQSMPVSDRVRVNNAGLLSQSKMVNVHGIASTQGSITVDLAENPTIAELQLVYLGHVQSHCRAIIGPVTVAMQTLGPVKAITPVQISLQGVELLDTDVQPQVHTNVTSVSARREVIRRIGERRARKPATTRQMNSRATLKTEKLLQEEMEQRISAALQEIVQELQKTQKTMDNFKDVLAPVVREGAAPHWLGLASSSADVTVNVASRRREQLAAPTGCPLQLEGADVSAQLHISFFNNIAETIMAGKTFTDKYFMNYGRIIQAELPPDLMVHSRSKRWAIVAAKPRPLEISIPKENHFRIELRIQRVEIDDEYFTGPTTAVINYELVKNDFEEYHLLRLGEVQLEASLPEQHQVFLQKKLNAFFAPVLDGTGVALPEGGSLGRLRSLQPAGVLADEDWLVIGVNMPDEFLEQWLPVADEAD